MRTLSTCAGWAKTMSIFRAPCWVCLSVMESRERRRRSQRPPEDQGSVTGLATTLLRRRPSLRVRAARTARWLEAFVLPLQEALIDVPHLAARNPGVLVAGREGLASTTRFAVDAQELGVIEPLLAWSADTGPWLSRAALRWYKVRDDPEARLRRPLAEGQDDPVFCEDVSRFLAEPQARRFVSALDSSSAARWICDPGKSDIPGVDAVQYRPLSRLAL